jgi:vanillate O-demethylase ferredoxin subunit
MTTGTLEVIIEDIKPQTPTVKSFKLAALEGSLLPGFSGGSHITTYIQSEQGLLERHYSLTNDPKETDYYQIAIRRSEESRGGSVYWHDRIKVGDRLQISYPKNHFPLSFKAKHHVFFAAGIGITPFLAMAADLKKNGHSSFELHYATPSKDLCAFYPYLTSEYPEESHFYFSKEKRKMKTDIMKNQPIGTHVYFCGSEYMMKEYASAARAYGYPEKSIHFELFTPPKLGPMKPFDVKLQKSNTVIRVPEGMSLLEALLGQQIDAPYSCKIGGCGSCQVNVLEGKVDHRDLFLSDKEKQEADVILTCVSRAKNKSITLDL